jgi:hypothetical protein
LSAADTKNDPLRTLDVFHVFPASFGQIAVNMLVLWCTLCMHPYAAADMHDHFSRTKNLINIP